MGHYYSCCEDKIESDRLYMAIMDAVQREGLAEQRVLPPTSYFKKDLLNRDETPLRVNKKSSKLERYLSSTRTASTLRKSHRSPRSVVKNDSLTGILKKQWDSDISMSEEGSPNTPSLRLRSKTVKSS